MIRKNAALHFIIAIAAVIVLSSAGCKEITIEGRISVKGNEPHTYLALTTQDHGELRLTGPLVAEIKQKYQNRILRVKGNITNDKAGPGSPHEMEVTEILEIK